MNKDQYTKLLILKSALDRLNFGKPSSIEKIRREVIKIINQNNGDFMPHHSTISKMINMIYFIQEEFPKIKITWKNNYQFVKKVDLPEIANLSNPIKRILTIFLNENATSLDAAIPITFLDIKYKKWVDLLIENEMLIKAEPEDKYFIPTWLIKKVAKFCNEIDNRAIKVEKIVTMVESDPILPPHETHTIYVNGTDFINIYKYIDKHNKNEEEKRDLMAYKPEIEVQSL